MKKSVGHQEIEYRKHLNELNKQGESERVGRKSYGYEL